MQVLGGVTKKVLGNFTDRYIIVIDDNKYSLFISYIKLR